jgi:hypothetical protein
MLSNVIASLSLLTIVSSRTFTVYNACPFTIWPAVFTDLNVGTAVPDVATGWEAPAGSNKTFTVPGNCSHDFLKYLLTYYRELDGW